MPTRTKKTVVDGADVTAEKPKKPRAPRKKAVEIPLKPHPIEQPAPALPPPVMPVGMKIEPVATEAVEETVVAPPPSKPTPRIPVAEDHQVADLWAPPSRENHDLSVPPPVLTAPKKMPAPEVEDIMAETERNELMHFERPDFSRARTPHSGFFRKLGIGFALVALAVLTFVGYITYAHATVVVYPKTVETTGAVTLNVVAPPAAGATLAADEVSGETAEVIVSGERSLTPGSASSTEVIAAAPDDSKVIYVGVATLYNQKSEPVSLVPTTRLLSPDGVLFRMKDRQTIPAKGTAKVSVYADKPGHSGALGPTKFTIPGLSTADQAVVWAETKSAMTAPADASTAKASGSKPGVAVTQDDLDKLQNGLREELIAQAKTQLAEKITGTWTGQEWIIDTMSASPLPAVGDLVDRMTLRLTLRVRQVSFDHQRAFDLVAAEIKRGLTSDHELLDSQAERIQVVASHDAGATTLRVTLTADTSVSLNSPLFDSEKLRGLDLTAVKAYFEGVDGVDRIDVRFRPFWLKRMPDLKEHIEFQIGK